MPDVSLGRETVTVVAPPVPRAVPVRLPVLGTAVVVPSPGLPGPAGPAGHNGEDLSPEQLGMVVDDVISELGEELTPSVDLVLLFENALA